MRTKWLTWFLAATALAGIGQTKATRWNQREVSMANHVWTSTTGDVAAAASWSSSVAPSTKATGTLTIAATVANGDTCTIRSKVYTFQTTLTDADGNVLIGADFAASKANLIAAINLGAGAGTTYAASMTIHPEVTASDPGGNDMLVTAKLGGTAPNAYATTETFTDALNIWGAATLAGGAINWASTDTVEFNGGSVVDATLNLDQSAVTITRITRTPAYTGKVGASGSPLSFIIAAKDTTGVFKGLVDRGSGTMYFKGAGTVGNNNVLCDSTNIVDALVLDGAIDNVYIKSGLVRELSGVTTFAGTRIYVNGISAYLIVDSGADNVHDTIELYSGTIECASEIALSKRARMYGGHWLQTGILGSVNTKLEIFGGLFEYDNPQGLFIGDGIFLGGVLDMTKSGPGAYIDKDFVRGPNFILIRGTTALTLGANINFNIDAGEEYP